MPAVIECKEPQVESEQKLKKDKKKKKTDSESPVKKEKKEKKEKKKKEEKEETKKRKRGGSDDDEPAAVEKKPKEEEKPQVVDKLAFTAYRISESTRNSLKASGINALFPIQAESFDYIYDGHDLLGRARTGTGKTLAFSLPMVEILKKEQAENPSVYTRRGRSPKVLVMTPTRELAGQVSKVFMSIASELKVTCVYGGVPYDGQNTAFRDGVDVVVGTPGRLIDHVERGSLRLADLKFICLDEADQMLDIGFAESMDKILEHVVTQKKTIPNSTPHQTLLFSATHPEWIKEAVQKYMRPEKKITVDLIGNEKMKASASVQHLCIPSRWQNRTAILGDILSVYGRGNSGRAIVFVETKGEANELAMNEKLKDSQVIHGDIVQKQREVAMQGFRDGKFSCLIATNVCARGVDIPEVDLVINCEPPSDVESYIHRSGRTGRAGRTGVCVTFYKPQQEYLIHQITRRAGVEFTKIGAPQPEDIIKAQASAMVETLTNEVDPQVLGYFTTTADQVLEAYQGDTQKALAACLAMICNTTKPLAARSLLSGNQGFVTLLFRTEQPIRNVGYVKSIMQRRFPTLVYDDTSAWRMTKDEMGVVLDIKSEKLAVSTDKEGENTISITGIVWRNGGGVTLEIPKEVPELRDFANTNGGSQGGYGQGNQGYGNRGGYGGRGGSGGRGGRGGAGGRFSQRSSGGGNPFDRASSARYGNGGQRGGRR